jgi:hypothetical protein
MLFTSEGIDTSLKEYILHDEKVSVMASKQMYGNRALKKIALFP